MTDKLIFEAVVSYADVDREERLTLRGVFKLLQDAAIAHANQLDAGSRAMARGESWVLNRIAAELRRYPRYEEAVRVETWSSGIRGFKGYRDFRVYDRAGEVIAVASSLWLYVNTRTKAIIRVPREVAEGFPVGAGAAFCPELESLEFAAPNPVGKAVAITLRYGDFDANEHVNHTAYFDFVQTAIAEAGLPPRPARLQIKFAKGIPAGTAAVDVRVAPSAGKTGGAVFQVERDAIVFAQGAWA